MKEFFSIFKNSLTRKCMALLMSLLVVGAASAQTRVTGTVTDESGHPLMGVTVIVVGTNTGAITNLQGQYSIAAKPGNTLEFQYLGMVSERKTVVVQFVIVCLLCPEWGGELPPLMFLSRKTLPESMKSLSSVTVR